LKVLHVNTIDTGGAAIAAKRLHLLLLENGVDSKILFLQRSGKANIPEAYYLEDQFKSALFKNRKRLNQIYNRRKTFYKPGVYFNGPESLFDISLHPLFNWADVIHLHWVVKMLDWKKVFAHKDKAFVWTLHDMNPFTGGEHYKTGYNGEFSKVSKQNIALKKNAIKGSNLKVVCPSIWLSELAKSSEVFKDKEVLVIRNPIDDAVFKPLHTYLHKSDGVPSIDKKNILFVAENPHDERKGFQLLLKALENIDPERYRLSVLGNKKFVESIFPRAFFYGTVHDEDQLVELYNQADLFVIPSLEDNLPNTVSEALLCGTPVIGMAIGGIKEIVENGIDGVLSETKEGLKQAIEEGLEKHFVRQLICNHARLKLNKGALLNQFKELYNSFKNQ
jgi:glycosyltransferase involved in cell wall biosynthesis